MPCRVSTRPRRRRKHGDAQVHIWRRSFDIPPPPLDAAETDRLAADPRYRNLPRSSLPTGESLAMTLTRVMPGWDERLAPVLREGKPLLVAAHGNSLRAVCKHLLKISDDQIPGLEIPTGNPCCSSWPTTSPSSVAATSIRSARGRCRRSAEYGSEVAPAARTGVDRAASCVQHLHLRSCNHTTDAGDVDDSGSGCRRHRLSRRRACREQQLVVIAPGEGRRQGARHTARG